MVTREEFEGNLVRLLNRTAEKVTSSAEEGWAERPFGVLTDEEATQLLFEAAERFARGDAPCCVLPDGEFTYEDPILANALAMTRTMPEVAVGTASPGEDLHNKNLIEWMRTGVHAWAQRKTHEAQELFANAPHRTIKLTRNPARIAVFGDGGYRGVPQEWVMTSITRRHQEAPFDLIVHLGDIYFSGTLDETVKHLIVPLRELSKSLNIPSVSLCGNHDLYAGPAAYRTTVAVLDQPARYFAVEAPGWRIACLDTALASMEFLRNDGRLDEAQLRWFDGLISQGDGQHFAVMSHHFIVSGWDQPARTLKEQLSHRVSDRIVAWYWGHEHRMAAYDRGQHGFWGACVGNGAFLEKWTPPTNGGVSPEWYARGRCECFETREHFWPHGYLELQLESDRLVERYHIENADPWERVLPIRSP